MSFRRKLLLVFSVSVALSVAAVAWLVQEVTRRSTPECAALVHDAPAQVAGFTTRQAAEDLAARFREFDAVAMHADDAADWRRMGRITREDMTAVLRDATIVVGEAHQALFA